ncbi:MAG: helix-turn-helix domain-containing protein [Clostridia bacterium]|nr:helix-turn-helix domain-containing protein [Clostridia bacterium]
MPHISQTGPIEQRWSYLKNYRYNASGVSAPYISVHNHDVELHDHPSLTFPGFRFELVYVEGGKGLHITENTEADIREGSCIFIDNGIKHGYKLTGEEPLTVWSITFEYFLVDETPSTFKTLREIAKHHMIIDNYESVKPIENFVFYDDSGKIRELYEEIAREHNDKRPGYRAIVKCKVLEILLMGLRSYFEEKAPQNYSPPIKKIIDYMSYGYMSNIPLADFAKNLNIPFRNLSKMFIEEVGMTYTSYVQKRKISESCTLLIESGESIEYISEYVGFSDSKKFRQKFKELTGMTPREYRKSHKSPGK